mmetsp:Transcript_2830/g.5258  ORF Transcript_2830/g.5258 Transcript_2830/m.5258 type:complete len:134 (+) Transcript_2830:2032-2433(+)
MSAVFLTAFYVFVHGEMKVFGSSLMSCLPMQQHSSTGLRFMLGAVGPLWDVEPDSLAEALVQAIPAIARIPLESGPIAGFCYTTGTRILRILPRGLGIVLPSVVRAPQYSRSASRPSIWKLQVLPRVSERCLL